MPEQCAITVYRFEELTDEAKGRAREWYRDGALDYPWYEFVYDDFEIICDQLGIALGTSSVRLMGGGARQKPRIYFRGFWSQGDGACFEGDYRYRTGASKAIRAHAPSDSDLHRIADRLGEVQRRNFYQLAAHARHRGHYYHEYCMIVDVERTHDLGQGMTRDAEGVVTECLRDLARWLYRRLEQDFDHLNADSAIDEAIEANQYRFAEDGRFHG
ncbi:MAG: antitoxin of toxin-antitoxin stability system [Asticcacaulis sp.]|uniref:antitoxin of toxin-antitoxin stability system n=1 Tax=Asticcacaulis sp. TaxID=1872648 RepID=UPI003F7BD53C